MNTGNEAILGFSLGFIIVFLVILITRLVSKNKNLDCNENYDERQQLVRLKAFKYGFFSLLSGQVVIMCINACLADFIIPSYILEMLVLFIGLGVFVVYAIMNDAYFYINQKVMSSVLLLVVICLINLICGVMTLINTPDFIDQGAGIPNILVAILFLVVICALVIKRFFMRDDADEES